VRVEPGELDLDRFRSLVVEAGSTADLAARSRLLREAGGLFRGTPLGDVEAPFATSEAAALDELRLAAVERHGVVCHLPLKVRRGQAAATSPLSAPEACAQPRTSASPGKVKWRAEPPERGRINRRAPTRMQIRRHIPSGPDAAGARCFQLPPARPL